MNDLDAYRLRCAVFFRNKSLLIAILEDRIGEWVGTVAVGADLADPDVAEFQAFLLAARPTTPEDLFAAFDLDYELALSVSKDEFVTLCAAIGADPENRSDVYAKLPPQNLVLRRMKEWPPGWPP